LSRFPDQNNQVSTGPNKTPLLPNINFYHARRSEKTRTLNFKRKIKKNLESLNLWFSLVENLRSLWFYYFIFYLFVIGLFQFTYKFLVLLARHNWNYVWNFDWNMYWGICLTVLTPLNFFRRVLMMLLAFLDETFGWK
jgi:hypothetical protein